MRDQAGTAKRSQKTPVFKHSLGGATTILVTAAQNATPVHKDFLKSMEEMCNHVNASDLLVIPFRYKNPTSQWSSSQENADFWDEKLTPYLCNTRKKLSKHLVVLGDVKVQPTASSPLTGFNAFTHGESAILGHTKLQFTTVPRPQGSMPKILTTTGAVTVPNYTDTRNGKLGEFHHTLGACVVQLSGKKFHIHQINAQKKTGEFIHLRNHYTPNGVKRSARYKALIMGDWHHDFHSPAVERATFGKGGLIELLEPEQLGWHDVNDNYACNPHTAGNIFETIAKVQNNRNSIREELERAAEFVVANTPRNCTSFIVPSNHNDFLARWIVGTDPRTTPANFKFWCETALHMANETGLDLSGANYPDPFVYWMKRIIGERARVLVLERGDSHMIGGIECGLHFDKGPNGTRGSRKNLCRIGVKTVGGHGHGPGIEEGAYQGGTSTGELRYARGSPSNWMNTHVAIDPLDKRCLFNIIGDEFQG